MRKRKTIEELTIKDNFMFGAVMMDEENCRLVLQNILGFSIERVEVSREKSIVYHPEFKGVRLDVYARDENNTRYNVEMQVATDKVLKRARYYHSHMDMECLETGLSYEELPDSYVVFICDFDPFGIGKYRYTLVKRIMECEADNDNKEYKEYPCNDGAHTVILNTKGANESEVPRELVKFLHFVGANLSECEKDFEDELVERLQGSVRRIKADRSMEERYMVFEEMMRKEYNEGKFEAKLEDILELLSDIGEVPEKLEQELRQLEDLEELSRLHKLAARVESINDFEEKM